MSELKNMSGGEDGGRAAPPILEERSWRMQRDGADPPELKQVEDFFIQLFEQASIGIAIISLNGRFLLVNGTMCEFLGYSHCELTGLNFLDVTLPHERERDRGHVEDLLAGRISVFSREKEYVRKDGSRIWGILQVNVIHGDDGRPLCFKSMIVNISKRKAAEAALSESERLHRSLIETTDTGYVCINGEDGSVISANQTYVELTGHRTLEEILGRSVMDWTAPYDRERNAEEVRRCLGSGRVRNLVVDYLHAEGKIVPIEINATVVETSQGRVIQTLCRDISERRQALLQLRESETFKDEVLSAAACGICLGQYDREQGRVRFTLWNPAMIELTGYTLEGINEQGWPHALIPDPKKQEEALGRFRESLAGRNLVDEIWGIVRRDGKERLITVSTSYLPAANNREASVLAIVSDVTDQMQLQEEHVQNALLEASANERSRLGQDLHDSLGQHLAGVAFLCKALEKDLSAAGRAESARVAEIRRQVNSAVEQADALARGLYPATLERHGLVAALRELSNQAHVLFNIDSRFECSDGDCEAALARLDLPSALHIYRICQENLHNATRHGRATTVGIAVHRSGDRSAVIAIADNGAAPKRVPPDHDGMGMRIMQFRARESRAEVTLTRSDDGWNRLICRIPIH